MNECENIEPDAGGNCLATCATERQVKKLRLFRIGLETAETDWQACDMAETWFVLPQICRNTGRLAAVVQSLYDAGARKFVAENYYAFEMLRQYEGVQIGAGSFIYVMNHYATAALRDIGAAWGNAGVGKPGGKYGGDGGEGSGANGSGGVCISAVVYVGGLHPSECMQGLAAGG